MSGERDLPAVERQDDGVRATAGAELFARVGHVSANGVGSDGELFSDLPAVGPTSEPAENLSLAPAEQASRRRILGVDESSQGRGLEQRHQVQLAVDESDRAVVDLHRGPVLALQQRAAPRVARRDEPSPSRIPRRLSLDGEEVLQQRVAESVRPEAKKLGCGLVCQPDAARAIDEKGRNRRAVERGRRRGAIPPLRYGSCRSCGDT